MRPAHRFILKLSRIIHVYLTLFGLAIILFFALTGFVLNHEDWFASAEPVERTVSGKLPTAILNPTDKFQIVELLRKDFGAVGAVEAVNEDESTIRVVFARPGLRSEAEIQREDGSTTVTFLSRGWLGAAMDLHRGKASGTVWSLVIDLTCGLLLVVAATGLVLWSSLKARGKFGAFSMLVGLLAVLAVYWWLVP